MVTRSEHRRQTLLRLSDAAVDLFEEAGAGATVDDIAARAGVSRRTVFRYVESKEELAFLHPVMWFDVFDDALASAGEARLAARLGIASQAISRFIDSDPDRPRQAFLVAVGHPELRRGFDAVFQRWVDRIAAEAERSGHSPFRARIIGAAVMGMVDAVSRQWLVADPPQTFASLCAEGYEVVAPLLEVEPDLV